MSFLDKDGLVYFYSKLKEKFIRSVTAGNDVLTPDADGNVNIVNVPTASNLTSPDAQTSYGTFIYRTSGGSASLTSGDAQLMYIDGNMEIIGRISENFDITATNELVVSYDAEQWRTTIDTSGTYYFRYTRPTSSIATESWSTTGIWTSDGIGEVILSTYGLTVQNIVNPSISISASGSLTATVVPSTFNTQISTSDIYNFVYSTEENSWQYNNENISLDTYGIAVTGTPDEGNTITVNFVVGTPDSVVTVVYTAAERGTIYVPQPTGFSATGFNQFDKDTMVIDNATFASGTIASGANTVAYCRAKGGVDNGYVAYSEGEYIVGIGWCAALPEIGSAVVTTGASVAASLASIPFNNDGYVVVEVTDTSDLCIHPKWSGAADTDYAEYVEPSVITFPLVDVEDVDLPLKTYGIPRIGAVPDTLDLDAGIYIQRIGRLANTPANMSTVIGYGTDYDYDDNYIYYVLPQSVTYRVNISPNYIVNDWGTEEFLDTEIAVNAQTLYSQNLRDKLRTDVLTISTQIPALTDSQLSTIAHNIGLAMYPIGSIYMSIDNVNPSLKFGGTWEQIKDKFLLSAGDTYAAGTTGGASTVTLTTNQIPAHTHGSKTLTGSVTYHGNNGGVIDRTSGIITGNSRIASYYADINSLQKSGAASYPQLTITATHTHDSVGSGQAHNNMPPYLAVYIWKRTA